MRTSSSSSLIRRLGESVFAVVLLGGLCGWSDGAAADPQGGQRVALEEGPTWTMSAAWSPDGSQLVVTDVQGGRLLRYDAAGKYLGSVENPGLGLLEFTRPTQIHPTSEGYLLRDRTDHWLWLDPSLHPLRAVSSRGTGGGFGMVDEAWTGSELVGFGYWRGPEGQAPRLGFLRIGIDPLALVKGIAEVDPASPGGALHSLLSPAVARVGESVYALRFGTPPFLSRIAPEPGRLRSFPQGFEELPPLPPNRGPISGPSRYKALETSTLPMALLASEDSLYLLTRSPARIAGTHWRLHRIDPRRDTLLGSLTLPTRAAHLLVVPGPKSWALFEKGSVTRPGVQAVESLLLVPANWIHRMGAPDAGEEPPSTPPGCTWEP